MRNSSKKYKNESQFKPTIQAYFIYSFDKHLGTCAVAGTGFQKYKS